MSTVTKIKTHIIEIDEARVIAIPKDLLEQAGVEDEVELELQGNQLVIRPVKKHHPREGWEEQLKAMAERGEIEDDELLQEEAIGLSSFDNEEWEW